jgi:hypothetical protein
MASSIRALLRAWLGVPTAEELDSQVSSRVAAQLAIRNPAGPPVAVDDNPENPSNWLSIAYVHDRVLEQLVAQNDRWEAADGRLRLILGLISVVFAVTIGLVPKTASSASDQVYLPFWVGAPAVAAAAVFLAAGLIAVRAYWPMEFDRPPAPDALRNEYLTTDPRITTLENVDSILVAYARNEVVLNFKFRAIKMALILTTIATGLFGAAAIIQLLLVTRGWG